MSTRKESVYTVGCPTHLLKYAWYHGKLSNEEANQLLTSMEGSCFLVREDKDNVGSMVLSVKSEEKVSHFVINRGPGWYEVDGTSKRFELVAELLTHYRNNFLTDNSHFLLGSPCQKRIDQSNSTGIDLVCYHVHVCSSRSISIQLKKSPHYVAIISLLSLFFVVNVR